MFRTMTRYKQQLSDEVCRQLLKTALRGVLSVAGDDGYPYGLPINFYYDEAEHCLWFHSGKSGHKLDALARNNKASFCVYDTGYHKNGHWSLNIQSVIVFGKIHIVENWSRDLMVAFCKRFTGDMSYIDHEIETFAKNTVVLRMDIEYMSGKLVNEA